MFMQHLARLPYQLAVIQFNMFDSHDIPRLHNNPNISFESYRAAVIMLFTYPGTPSIYYGDEIGLEGNINSMEGCRYPMQWDKRKHKREFLKLYSTLAHLKQIEEALQTGGFKILYARDYIISYARFTENKAFIVVCSQNDAAAIVYIPVRLVGVQGFSCITEIFGRRSFRTMKDGTLEVQLQSKESLLIEATLM